MDKDKTNQMANNKQMEFIKDLPEEDIMEESSSSAISQDSLNRERSSSSSTPSSYGPTSPALTTAMQSEITLNKLAISTQNLYATGGFPPAKPSAVFVSTTDSHQSKSM